MFKKNIACMDLYSKINELTEKNVSFVIVTVVDHKGSAPGKTGFKMVVLPDGNILGTVGGGAIEQKAIADAGQRLVSGQSGLQEYLLSNKNTEKEKSAIVVPMSCSGRVTFFYEVHGMRPVVYVFGGGHVGQALLRQLSYLDYHTILIDNREDFSNIEKNPHASENIFSDYEKYASEFAPMQSAFIVILTHGHKYDFKILDILYKRNMSFPYTGIIASKAKAAEIFRKIKQNHGDDVDLSNVHAPIGLDIGGTTADEIALAIAAQIQSVRYKTI